MKRFGNGRSRTAFVLCSLGGAAAALIIGHHEPYLLDALSIGWGLAVFTATYALCGLCDNRNNDWGD